MKKLILLALLWAAPALALTTQTRYVDTDCANNGDGTASTCAASAGAAGAYKSLSQAESDMTTDNANLTSSDIIVDILCAGATADTTAVDINGQTTDSTRYIRIRCDPGKATGCSATGKWNTGTYRISNGNVDGAIKVQDLDVRIENIQIEQTGAADANPHQGIHVNNVTGAAHLYFLGNIIRFNGTTPTNVRTTGIAFPGTAANVYVVNNIVYDFPDDCIELFTYGGGSGFSYYYNNTAYGCSRGLNIFADGASDTVVLKNNLFYNNTSADYFKSVEPITTYTNSNNLTKDATSPNATFASKTVTFTNEASDDFTLASGDTEAKDKGTDLSADSGYAFAIDQQRLSRSGTWDIGADEYQSSGSETLSIFEAIGEL